MAAASKRARQPLWRRPGVWLITILIIQFVLGTARIAAVPLWRDHEVDFYDVVHFLIQNGRLPAVEDYPAGDADIRQATQPPLHFLLMAPVMALFYQDDPAPPGVQPPTICFGAENFNRTQVIYPHTAEYDGWPQGAAMAGYALRFVSLICGLVTTAVTYAVGRILAPRYAAIALAAAAMIAFEPSVMALNTTISNDASVMMVAAINLYFALMLIQTRRWRYAVLMVIFAVLAIFTRLPGWAVAGFSGVVLAYAVLRAVVEGYRRKGRRILILPAVVLIAGVIGLAAIMIFNYSRSGSFFGRYAGQEMQVFQIFRQPDVALRISLDVLKITIDEFGIPLSRIASARFVLLQNVTLMIGLAGAALLVIAGVVQAFRKRAVPLAGGVLVIWLAALFGIGLVIIRNVITVEAWGGVTEYNFAAIYTPMRYYAPALPPLALLVAVGFWALANAALALLPKRISPDIQRRIGAAAPLIPAALGLALLVITGISIARAVAERPTVPAFTSAQFAAQHDVTLVDTPSEAGFPQIVGYRAVPDGAGYLQVAVYAAMPSAPEWNSALMLTLGNDTCTFLPARGYSGTLVWRPDTVYALETRIANCSNPEDQPLSLAAIWQGANLQGEYLAESSLVELGTVDALPQGVNCPANLGIIDGGYQIVRLNTPETVARGENYQPALNWIVLHKTPEAYGRRFVFTHTETGVTYTCEFIDRTMNVWVSGEYVFSDRCVIVLPDDAPTGVYTISVIGLNAAGEPLPAVGAAGEPLPDNAVPVGQVAVT